MAKNNQGKFRKGASGPINGGAAMISQGIKGAVGQTVVAVGKRGKKPVGKR